MLVVTSMKLKGVLVRSLGGAIAVAAVKDEIAKIGVALELGGAVRLAMRAGHQLLIAITIVGGRSA